MRLPRQLLLVSLLTLALPWAGCEYIREMEKTLRQGQATALQATARAVAARLASDPETQRLIEQAAPAPLASEISQPIYVHPLQNPPMLDGYNDDWRDLDLVEQHLHAAAIAEPSPLEVNSPLEENSPPDENSAQNEASVRNEVNPVRLWAGRVDDELFIFAEVTDDQVHYYSPQRGLTNTDHLQLRLKGPGLFASSFSIYTAAPGQITVINHNGQREHRIRGAWQEWQHGYQLELRLPLEWARQQLGITWHDASADGSQRWANFPAEAVPPALITPLPQLDQALAVFVPDAATAEGGTQLRLATERNWIIARAGHTQSPPPPASLDGEQLLTRIYRLALGEQQFPALPDAHGYGRFAEEQLPTSSPRWYDKNGQQIVRLTVPVQRGNSETVATVVAEQSTDTLHAMTNSAFNRLVSYSLLAFAVTGLGLLAYASWLSWRIRRLSRATEHAVDEAGRIRELFRASRAGDEIGDLSRRYADLLQRLRHYNHYLETLASKLSHELRTPLAVVRSSLDNLEHEQLPPQAQTYSARARDGAERLSHILTAMSAASRVEQSIQSAELESIDLHDLLRDLSAAYADVYPHVSWRFTAADDDYRLLAAPELLVQMVDKLADNAAGFCPAGETVGMRLERNGAQLILQVSNPGPTLPEDMRGQLFDSLVSIRAPDTRQSDQHHLGLGLYIVRLIADFHGGKVAADNGPTGSGACFTICLPKTSE